MTRGSNEDLIDGEGGVKLFLRSWRPDDPRGVVVICHGFNSHSGHYRWTAEHLVAAGLAVYAFDLRGRGQSGGARFFVKDIAEYVGDLDQIIELSKTREPGLPTFLLGHSAGGVVSATYALDNGFQLDGFICESFAYQVPAPDFALKMIKALARVAPNAPVLKLKNEDFSRYEAVVDAMNEDPLIHNEVQPAATVAALVRANERLKAEFSKIRLPLLILHGTVDKATLPAGSQAFNDNSASPDKTLNLYLGHVHDLLNDIGKELVMTEITAWIEERIRRLETRFI